MAKRESTGRNEVGMLSDLKGVAERIGSEVLGFEIEWLTETEAPTIGRRPDVEIRKRNDGRDLLILGEAKRPETSAGVHSFVKSEFENAARKAVAKGCSLCFTTNFLTAAIWEPNVDAYMDALRTDEIRLLSESVTETSDWWKLMTGTRRDELIAEGLTNFFQQLRLLLRSSQATTATHRDEVYLSIFRASSDSILAEAFPHLWNEVEARTLPTGIVQEAKRRELDLSKPEILRYFTAQAVAEVLTAGLFYETVRPAFSLGDVIGGINPSTSTILAAKLTQSLSDASRVTGDYETIFGLSEAAKYVVGIENDTLRNLWIGLFRALDGLEFSSINSEIIGVIFERLISTDRRQEMGQHYTQTRLARAMTSWAVVDADSRVADFSSGGGTFLVETYNVLRQEMSHQEALKRIFGNDLDSFAAHLATVNLATRDVYRGQNFPAVSNRDAFDIFPGDPAVSVTPSRGAEYKLEFPNSFDAVLGNPPYDEKGGAPEKYRATIGKIANISERDPLPPGIGDNINLAAWFVLLSVAWVSDGGRIALVLPTSVLQNEKHAVIIPWLRKRFNMTFWHTESDVWFSDARVSPFVMFLEPHGLSSGSGSVHFVNVLEPITGKVVDGEATPIPEVQYDRRDLSRFSLTEDLLAEGTVPAPLRDFEQCSGTCRVDSLPGVSVFRGNKLGHAMFRLKDRHPGSDSVKREVVGFDIQASISRKYLLPLLKSPDGHDEGLLDSSKFGWWILNAPEKLPKGGGLEAYVRMAQRAGAAEQPSVKQRGEKWWHVDWKPAQIHIGAHPQFQPLVWWAKEPIVATDNFQSITFANDSKINQELIAASLASAFGVLSSLYRSNEVGCEGVRWVSTRNVESWPVLDSNAIEAKAAAKVVNAYRKYQTLPLGKLYELPLATREAWVELTTAVAEAAGRSNPEALAKQAVQVAIATTQRRREREGNATAGRTRLGRSGSGKLVREIRAETERCSEFSDAVDLLTAGPDEVRLHAAEIVESLFEVDEIDGRQRISNALVERLGDGFLAAPVWSEETVDSVQTLFDKIANVFVARTEDGSPAEGYEQTVDLIETEVRKCLAGRVKKLLK